MEPRSVSGILGAAFSAFMEGAMRDQHAWQLDACASFETRAYSLFGKSRRCWSHASPSAPSG